MGAYSIQHLSTQSVEAFWLILCLNCGVYDTISVAEFLDFLWFKVTDVTDNFSISKINVKFENQFTAPF